MSMYPTAVPRIALLVAVLASAGIVSAQQTAVQTTAQSGTDVTFDLPSAGSSELIRHVTEANFQILARPDTGMTVLPQEQDNRYTVTMQGDMLFRNDGYQVRTDARVLERHPQEVQFLVDVTTPDGPAAQVVTPQTVQEQVTVDSGTYDATVIVRVDGQAVYREQRRMRLASSQQTQMPQEQEQAVEEQRQTQQPEPQMQQPQQQPQTPANQPQQQPPQEQERSVQEQQNVQVQQQIQRLEQRIMVLEQELRQLRQRQRSNTPDADTGQQPGQQSPAVTAQDNSVGTTDAGSTTVAQGQVPMEAEAAAEERPQTQQQSQEQGPLHIVISFFQ
jgi:flagellar biosynthesis GTPase FlhF